MRWLPQLGLALMAALVVSGCRAPEPAAGADLFDDRHAPLVLVETRGLAPPPDVGPNRFVRGWLPWRREDRSEWLVPQENARLELVELVPRARRLIFDGELLSAGPAWAEVRAGGERWRLELSDRVSVELPPADGPGRRVVDLRLEEEGSWAVRAVAVEPTLTGGSARCDRTGCLQAGPSVLEAVRWVRPGTRLAGVFVPPARPRPPQRFRLSVVNEEGAERELFAWRPSWIGRFAGDRSFEHEIGEGDRAAWVRLRFTASGEGPAAVWKRLRLVGAAPPPEPPAVPAPPRLVMLYVMDAMRADHVTHFGGAAELTPVIDRLAADGATFHRHQSAAPSTLPATKTLFTGETYRQRGGWGLGAESPATLAEAFRDAGFRTAMFSGNVNASAAFGTDRGFAHAEDSVLIGGPEYRVSGADHNDNARRIHRAALDWLDGLARDESALLYLHTIHPHTPYAPSPDLEERFTRDIDSRIDGSSATLRAIGQRRLVPGVADRQRLKGLYAASVAYNDREIGRFLSALEDRFDDAEVLFVLTSDHGEELFDHGGVLHGYTLYDEMLRIPLIVRWPGTIAPAVIDRPSGTVDVHDALRAMVDPGRARRRPGFWRHLGPGAAGGPKPEVQFAAASNVVGGIFSARSERWKVIWAPRQGLGWGMGTGDGRTYDPEYVFDLAADRETLNRAGERDPEVDWLRSRLAAWIDSGLAAESDGEEARLDERARDRLRALGYLD